MVGRRFAAHLRLLVQLFELPVTEERLTWCLKLRFVAIFALRTFGGNALQGHFDVVEAVSPVVSVFGYHGSWHIVSRFALSSVCGRALANKRYTTSRNPVFHLSATEVGARSLAVGVRKNAVAACASSIGVIHFECRSCILNENNVKLTPTMYHTFGVS